MTISNRWYISFIAALLVALSASDALAGLTQDLNPSTITPGMRGTFSIRLDQAELTGLDLKNEENVPELFDEPLTKADGLLLLDRGYQRTPTQFIWTFAFTAYLPGTYRIPAVEIRFGPQTFSSHSQDLIVQTTRAEGDEEMVAEFSAESVPEQIPYRWIFAGLGILVAYVLFRLLQKRYSYVKPVGSADSFEDPETKLRRALEAWSKADLAPAVRLESFTEILRIYLKERYLLPTSTMTLRELVDTVEWTDSSVETKDAKTLRMLMKEAEATLFNQAPPQGDFEKSAAETTRHIWLRTEKPHDL